MTNLAWMKGVPRKVLLATDLSARCDRALDRAVFLATGWQAQLTILHVLEQLDDPTVTTRDHAPPSWRRPPDALAIARQRIRQGLRADVGDALEKAVVLIEEGDPAEVIERIAAAEGSELIVTGIAREEPFARRPVMLGKTVDRLLRRAPMPILIVKNRPRASYEHILVATDFSESSRPAVQVALAFFPFLNLRLLHAFEAPHSDRVSDPARYEDQYRRTLAGDLDAFLAPLGLTVEQRRRIDPLIERGQPGQLIREYVRDRGADLVVLGTRGRSALVEALIGSTAKSILSILPCDALVVRA